MDVPGPDRSGWAPQGLEGGQSPPYRWGTVSAVLLCWLMPATAAKRSAKLRLRWAFAIHIVFALLTVLLFMLLAVASDTSEPARFVPKFLELIGDAIEELVRHPKEFTAALGGITVGIEVGYLVLAGVLMAWGAKDEPIRASFANALRRLWLHTVHVAAGTLIGGLLCLPFVRAEQAWWRQEQPVVYMPPQPPKNAQPGTPAWDAYNAELQAYHQQYQQLWQERYQRQAWHVKHTAEIVGYVCFTAGIWVLWAVLRAIAADRLVPPIVRPPTCETCGYNLTAAPIDGRCPECGETVLSSLGADVRPGPVWQRRHDMGPLRAWWRCCIDVIARPRWFGRQLRTVVPGGDHRLFLAMHLPAIFLIAAVGLILLYIVSTGRNPFVREPDVIYIGCPAAGVLTAAILLGVATLSAGVAAGAYRISHQRNLMPAAMQAAAYLAGYLVLWTAFAALWGTLTSAIPTWFSQLSRTLFIDVELLAFGFWFLPNAACLLLYFTLVWRATAGARYANH